MMQTAVNVLTIAQGAWLKALETAKVIVDATSGAGKDTLFLAQHKRPEAHIYAFDVQPTAMIQTKKTTEDYKEHITYILDSHENINQMIKEKLDLVVFNLGYLPGGEHAVSGHEQAHQVARRKRNADGQDGNPRHPVRPRRNHAQRRAAPHPCGGTVYRDAARLARVHAGDFHVCCALDNADDDR